jgi:hypothetical protein
MGGGRGGVVSDPKPKPAEPDNDLLEFLGGIDEVNDESQDEDFSDFLARTDIDKLAAQKAKPPQKDDNKDEKSE